VVIPQLKTVILDSGVPQEQLPLTTQILFGAGDFFSKYYLIVIVLFGAGVYGIVQYLRSEEGKMMFSTLMLKVPVIGSFLRQLYVSRFCRTFSVLLDGAIPVAQALEIAGDVIGNAYYQDVIYIVAEGVRQGEPISDVLARYADYFPPLVSQMIAIGEKTGRMSDLLKKVSQFYNREVESMVNSLAELIQPVLIVGVGILIAGLIAAIIMPIYQIAQQF
jgi:type II secretory pathway component PulF